MTVVPRLTSGPFGMFRDWQMIQAASIPAVPPYDSDMMVTPLSRFGENTWLFPENWAPVNVRDRLRLYFNSEGELMDGTKAALHKDKDAELLRQLKEAMVAVIFRRNALAEGRERARIRYGRPTGFHSAHGILRRFFIAASAVGCRSLSQLTPELLGRVTALLATTAKRRETVAKAVDELLALSRQGLISDGLRDHDFEISAPDAQVIDTTGTNGWQPLPDGVVSELIRVSKRYVELTPDITRQIAALLEAPKERLDVIEWSRSRLPCGERFYRNKGTHSVASTLAALVHVACGNLIAFHVGPRAGELLSLRKGCIRDGGDTTILDLDLVKLDMVTFKGIQDLRGKPRELSVHPYLATVEHALVQLSAVIAPSSEYLFATLHDGDPYITNRWNYRLQQFASLHGIEAEVSSHQWRKTVASVAVRVMTGAAVHLKTLFGHARLGPTAGYIMASPFIRDEVRSLSIDAGRKQGKMLLESSAAFGGPGLGGRQGKQLETRLAALIEDTDITEGEKLKQTLDEWIDEMLRQGILPLAVMPGVFCMKPMLAKGDCATSSGDRLADPARCSARCSFQVQQAHRRDLVRWSVSHIVASWESWSDLQQKHWAAQCRDQLVAWPELVGELGTEIPGWPALSALLAQEPRHGR